MGNMTAFPSWADSFRQLKIVLVIVLHCMAYVYFAIILELRLTEMSAREMKLIEKFQQYSDIKCVTSDSRHQSIISRSGEDHSVDAGPGGRVQVAAPPLMPDPNLTPKRPNKVRFLLTFKVCLLLQVYLSSNILSEVRTDQKRDLDPTYRSGPKM